MSLVDKVDWVKCDGLVPVVVQDYKTLQVLMLGYMNKEAVELTEEDGKVTFFSRTKQRIWQKGETSGNFLFTKSLALDCDNDTILAMVNPIGPTCHKGTNSCFESKLGIGFLGKLEKTINQRIDSNDEKSYTLSLIKKGISRIAQKVGEEGVEVALSAVTKDGKLLEESGDLLYHLLVLLASQKNSLDDVIRVLEERHK